MKQIYSIGSIPAAGASLDSTPAPGRTLRLPSVRASTSGILPDQLLATLPTSFYGPPPGRGSESDQPLPVRLSLLATASGRVLTHVTPRGESYFAHSLLNVPDSADAQLAIQTWGSPLWQRHEPDGAADLPELPYLPVADLLDDATLKTWLETPYKRELLEFALSAFLGGSPGRRIFLAAGADDVAKVVYALTRALPQNLVDDFTFSTFESDPLACAARLIGHEAGSAERDLPLECYRAPNAAMHAASGKRSDLAVAVPYAAFAVESLTRGEFAALEEIKATWQRLGLKDARQLDLVFRITRETGELSKPEAIEALQHPPLTAWLGGRGAALQQLLEWALEDRAFATQSFSRAVQSLRQKPDTLAKLAGRVREVGANALKQADRDRAATAFEVVLPMLAPAKANAIWGEFLAGGISPDSVEWNIRWYLLPRFARFKQQTTGANTPDESLARWLAIPADKLGEFLQLDLPKPYWLTAARSILDSSETLEPETAKTLAGQPGLALSLLQSGSDSKAVELFDALEREAADRPWFEEIVGRAAEFTATRLNRFFESTLAANRIDADRLVRTQGTRLLEQFNGQSGLDRLATQFLAITPADALQNGSVHSFLSELRKQPQLDATNAGRIDAVFAVRQYLDHPEFSTEAMAPLAAAFAIQPAALPASAKNQVFDAVVRELDQRSSKGTLQADFESLLLNLGPVLANDATDLYENTLRAWRGFEPDFAKHPNRVETFLALALGAAKLDELRPKLEGLDSHAFALASEAAKLGKHPMLDELDRRAKPWPREARTKWGFLLAAVRPRSRWKRDAVCGLIGAGLAAVAALVLQFAI